uniref:Uncharacterized protein n=1 Tax=Anguilla anguilla TaxID=7936 RepID=A0A0E9QQB2_ANGAN
MLANKYVLLFLYRSTVWRLNFGELLKLCLRIKKCKNKT